MKNCRRKKEKGTESEEWKQRRRKERLKDEIFCTDDEDDFNKDIHVNSSDVFNVQIVTK